MGLNTQTFNSPGTWTNPNPSVVKRARVHVIGGGGGGSAVAAAVLSFIQAGDGGGGGYKTAVVPVGPTEPITVGAGGSAGSGPGLVSPGTIYGGSVGGTTTFGTGASLVSVDGGAGSGATLPACNAPASGGGGASYNNPSVSPTGGSGGLGMPAIDGAGGGMFSSSGKGSVSAVAYKVFNAGMFSPSHPYGKYCGGGGSGIYGGGASRAVTVPTPNYSGTANTGGGGSGLTTNYPGPPTVTGGSGGSGFVVVEWYE